MEIMLPYGSAVLTCHLPKERVQCVLESRLDAYHPLLTQAEIVKKALDQPIGSLPLHKLAEGCQHVVIIASDHTRPVPSRLLMPLMLDEIRRGIPDAAITILIATGCHRDMSKEEMIAKFGEQIVASERIVVHDSSAKDHVCIGTLPSGGKCYINLLAAQADLLVSEGFIEPHFFAGFSGGRKSVLPGISARETVLANHCAHFIAHKNARAGILDGNPIHEDMIWAARQAGLAFILNVVLNEKKEVVYAVAGDVHSAHRDGCSFLMQYCGVSAPAADIVIATNGGHPLDQNIYQAAKGINTAQAAVKPGGIIIMLAKSEDGHGGEGYYRQLKDHPNLAILLSRFMERSPAMTEPDQWQTQIQIQALEKAHIIYISDADEQMVRDMHMIPAKSVENALQMADELIGHHNGKISVIPDAVSIIFQNTCMEDV